MPRTRPYWVFAYALLCLALLPIMAEAAPDSAPSHSVSAHSIPPAKKPEFGSFRMQPILEPHLNARKPASQSENAPHHTPPQKITGNPEHSLGTLTLRPIMRPVTPAHDSAAENTQTPQTPPTIIPPQKAPLPPQAPETQISQPEKLPETEPTPTQITASLTSSGLPFPVRKPIEIAGEPPTTPNLLERIIATAIPSETADSVADIPANAPIDIASLSDDEAEEDSDLEPIAQEFEAPSTPVRINRFDGEQRMAGSGAGSGYTLGNGQDRGTLPATMQGIRIGRLQESKEESPIFIPGLQKAAIPRAPDIPRSIDQTRPEEVILFFEENSNRLESGQMAIIHTDVIEMLRRRPELKIDIIGYAEDTDLPDIDASQLSRARALMLRDYLIRNKIDERRIMVTGRANKTRIEPRDRADLFFTR